MPTLIPADSVQRIVVNADRAESANVASTVYLTSYIGAAQPAGEGPEGFLVEIPAADATVAPHFHRIDQFQVLMTEGSAMGKHTVPEIAIHYTDGYTPYGPIIGNDSGLAFYTLRAHADVPYAYPMPNSRKQLRRTPGRSITVSSGLKKTTPIAVGAATIDQPLPRAEDGVAAYTIRVPAGQTAAGPDPSDGGGQYYLVVNGTWDDDDCVLGPRSLAWVSADEPAPELKAGVDGLELIVMQFRRDTEPAPPYDPADLPVGAEHIPS